MTNEQLMMPRYEVIADYPMSHQKVGYIYVMPNYTTESTQQLWVDGMDKYPHLFKKLEWWEGRSVFEMPKYLKNISSNMVHYGVEIGEVLKVDKYGPWDDQFYPTKFNKTYYLQYVVPATKEEYETYLSNKHKQKK